MLLDISYKVSNFVDKKNFRILIEIYLFKNRYVSIYIYIFVIYSANQQIVQRIRIFFFFSLKREMRKSIAQGGFDPHTYTYARIHTHTHTHTYICIRTTLVEPASGQITGLCLFYPPISTLFIVAFVHDWAQASRNNTFKRKLGPRTISGAVILSR